MYKILQSPGEGPGRFSGDLQVMRDGAHAPGHILAYLIEVASALAVHMRPPSNALLPSLRPAKPRSEIRCMADAAQDVSAMNGGFCPELCPVLPRTADSASNSKERVPWATRSGEQPDPCGNTINSEHRDDMASLQRVEALLGGSLGLEGDLPRGLRFRLHLEGLRALEWGLHLLHVS
jgi:hypothetical protein